MGYLLVVMILGFLASTQGYKFYDGGKDGWVVSPSENYNHWAERMRFQVNDTLFFKYKKGSDSVLLVTKEDYFACKTGSPILSLTEGDSTFTFDRSGPFFFITGNAENCNKGQKLIVVVMAVRHKPPQQQPPPASPSPSSAVPVPTPSPVSPPTSPVPEINTPAPESSEAPSDSNAEKKSGLFGVVCSTWLMWGLSALVSMALVDEKMIGFTFGG